MARQIYLPGANPYSDGWNGRGRRRIDARPQNSAATAAGMRGVHRDTRGNVIGGYTAEGEGIGTKGGNWRKPMDLAGMPPAAEQSQPVTTAAPPLANSSPAASSAAPKRSWRDGMATQGTIGADLGAKPTPTGGGLWRWNELNPDAGKFGQKRPMAPGEIRDAPVVAEKPLGPSQPKVAAPAATAPPVAKKKASWRQPVA
ncbi:hypothetical protein OKA04_12390 [Luteolibacter flavescens]|uniref:Uncharacterized protein n=1 Tax=Luteolibacter flavescens TaxID=1859460 RepID=A0ABT3FPN4_9BACT|nr:hypothetical protein [Luteolibacter flavescens]MCW1885530.1 hypothetical protein [Luteolibacter flavescens]